jgi:hypothetical protein
LETLFLLHHLVLCKLIHSTTSLIIILKSKEAAMIRNARAILSAILLTSFLLLSGCSTQQSTKSEASRSSINLDTVKAGQFDTGKMWTFVFPPIDYFAKSYNFNPTKEWFDKARLAALRLPGCTAAFVSEDGLFMTNHHCARGPLERVQKEGEKLVELGFYAPTLEEERKAAVYVDQLVVIDDVTKEVQEAYDSGTTDSAKTANRMAKFAEIQQRYYTKFKETTKDSMLFQIYSFYNGGRYSLYGFKRYTDVRLVYAPEEAAAFYGGDPDNFTYPRYDFDCSFFRVYEDGKPIKTSNFFRFSKVGAQDGDAVFVIGNPGSTSRLLTMAQLETLRDLQYPVRIDELKSRYQAMQKYVENHPDQKLKYMNQIFGVSNSLKATKGYLSGLVDPYLMAKKQDFEKTFKNAVLNKPELKNKYGDPWTDITNFEEQRRAIFGEVSALTGTRSQYYSIATRLVNFARNPESERAARPEGGRGQGGGFGGGRGNVYPANLVPEIERPLLADQLRLMRQYLGDKNESFNRLMGARTPEQAADYLIANSIVASKEKFDALVAGKPEDILNSTDPLISFAIQTQPRAMELQRTIREISQKETIRLQSLGRAMYEVYGTTIPPDATFSLRIADGVVKGYDYNGTIAPPVTTFYGMYDRYYSFGKKDPWLLPDRWANPPADFKMSTPMNFVSTNDIIGGNSGSSVINKNLEVVGLIFDGNIESLPGAVIYDETYNRSVSVHTAGILEGLEKIYKADRLAKELEAGKIAQ